MENNSNYQVSEKNIPYTKEVQRKLIHIAYILFFPALYAFLSKKLFLSVMIPMATLIIATDYCRHRISSIKLVFDRIFSTMLRPHELESNGRTGASYMAISAILTFSFFPKIIAIVAFSILAVSDCLAALIGKKMTSKEFFEKSVAGSIAFGVSALLLLIVIGIFDHQKWYYYLFGTLAVFATTIIEARPSFFEVDDNLTIPLVFAFVMVFFAAIWGIHY